jgi:hypothetical protein
MLADLGQIARGRCSKCTDRGGFFGKKFVGNQIAHFHRPSDLK